MQQEDHREIDWDPGHVVEREYARRTEVGTADCEVAQHLHPVGARVQRSLNGPNEAFRRHAVLDPGGQALHDMAPHGIEYRHDQYSDHHHQRQVKQRVQHAGGQHSVEHLHHVD
ncbi:MAG: hypothetical protein ACJ8AW_01440 [Rhodopila sp.]